jgi:hypothetical protein
MGNYINLFEKNEQEQKIILSPTKSDFITGYADLTGRNQTKYVFFTFLNMLSKSFFYSLKVAVVEVQRYWARFKQLGSDRYCNIPKGILERGELGLNPFTKNVQFFTFKTHIFLV